MIRKWQDNRSCGDAIKDYDEYDNNEIDEGDEEQCYYYCC
jgi:hypothetical protein